jgi:phage FluMu protein Com
MQGVGQASTTYFLEVLEPSGESYPIQRYDAYPDLNVLMVKAIDHAIYFEEHILCGMDPAKFDTLKAEVIAYLKKLHPECKFINFKRCFGNFIFLQFQPQETYYHHSVGVAFDHVNSRYYYLTSLKSYEKFLTTNRIELVGKAPLISEKTAVLLVDLLKLTAALSFNKVFIESNELLLSSPYCTPAVKTEVEQKLAKLDSPVHYARLSGDTIVFYTADYLYPSNLVKWTISEKDGKVSLTNKLLLENLFVPSFILNDSLSPEEGSNYIR